MNRLLASVAIAALVVACTTPQPALDQANHGVKLAENLRAELVRYQRNVEIAGKRRIKVIEEDEAYIGLVSANGALTDFLRTQSGMSSELAGETLLRNTADERGKFVDEQEKARQELAAQLAQLLKDLPSPAEKLGAVQKTMAELGSELSASERIKIVSTFLNEVKAIADKNAKQASAEAASNPQPPATQP
jgi:hypothetical protein